ncbi:acetyltransferase, ribosomal protein N-acetylase [Polaromonas sp. CF318]|uniref:GNAT family N-acetyltransferase n=1 Tax=Polaromonas sp. CF318 TaxID=1144318 RepID=UPI000270FA13|nr:GNAT family N-acetyltransferase [Polaromonas sp. CF318]EJL78467.1 acetyltransferase, ribosomal protein N-acetylase [Polaromonas sp. CF318]
MDSALRAPQSAAAVNIGFRPLQAADLPMLHGWLARPHWTEWWGPGPTLAEVEAEYGAWINDPRQVQPHIALLDGRPFAYIQSYVAMGSGDGWWENETDPGVRGIDQSIADAAQLGRGLGTAMVKAFVARLLADPQVTHIQTDPDPRNARAIRCYEKAGFRVVGEVQTPDGTALLMVCRRTV